MTATETQTIADSRELTESGSAPDMFVPCWGGLHYPELRLCVDQIAEWILTSTSGRWSGPVCTGCMRRFRSLNPDWVRAVRL